MFIVSLTLALLALTGVSSRTILGNERLRSKGYEILNGRRVAVLSNPTGVYQDSMRHIVDDMNEYVLSNPQSFEFVLIFGPEHGFRGELQAETGDPLLYIDKSTGLPVYSAYLLNVTQLRDVLIAENITSIVVDMQDVGVRLYTFIWTMYNVLLAASEAPQANGRDVQVVVCDRPNPNGGLLVDGPMLDPAFASGYGRIPIPFLHGMTIGELARLFSDSFPSPLKDLQVLSLQNWERQMLYPETGLVWVPPSPNLPTVAAAEAYAATVFLEATTVSEGRGTCTPFTLFGAPFFGTAEALAAALNTAFGCTSPQLACFRAAYYSPTFQKYNGTVVAGVQLLNRPPGTSSVDLGADNGARETSSGKTSFTLRDFASATRLLKTLKQLASPPSAFVWDGSWFGHPGTELIDQYAGTDKYREMLDAGLPVEEIVQYFAPKTEEFKLTRRKYLLYN